MDTDQCSLLLDLSFTNMRKIYRDGQKSVCKFAKSEKTKMLFYEKSILFNYTAVKIITDVQNGFRSYLYT